MTIKTVLTWYREVSRVASVAQFNTKGTAVMDKTLSSLVRLKALRERVEVEMILRKRGEVRNKFVRVLALLDQRVAIMADAIAS